MTWQAFLGHLVAQPKWQRPKRQGEDTGRVSAVEEQGHSDGSRQKENGSLCLEAGKDDCNSTPGASAGECSASKQQNGEGTGVRAEGQGEEWRLLGDHRKQSKGRTDAGVSN